MLTPDEEVELLRLQEEEIAYRASESLAEYAELVLDIKPARHHRLLIDALEDVESGLLDVLIVTMPPGSAKSTYGSVAFPAWYLGRHPSKCVIAASHTGELAERFGRRVRNIVAGREHMRAFPRCGLSGDSAAAGRWETAEGGEYFAAGVGGSITGRRADLAIIDDPVKSREEADSETIREKQWAWWRDDMSTRLKPGAAVVLIMCMTGDTPVLMADGTEKPLATINVGDVIASYKDGALTTSVVRNWKNQGADSCFEIRTVSGKIVRANERHPFLVCNNGELKWTKLKNLRPGDLVMSARVHGEESNVPLMDAKSRSVAKDFVNPTTTRIGGQGELGRLPSIQSPAGLPDSGIGTESSQKSSMSFSNCRAESAQYVDSRLPARTPEHTGITSFALTTTMKQEGIAGCFATTATLQLGTERQRKYSAPPLNIYELTEDEITSITPCGSHDVFDIEVADTENFIANGLVSHNTRWHEDDLAGRLLADLEGTATRYKVIKLPMVAQDHDPLGRVPGELLWPEWFTVQMVEQAKREPRTWTALYQQEPRPIGGGEFRKEWLSYWRNPPATTNKVILVDPSSGKTKTRGDFTSMWVIGAGQDGNYYVLDGIRDRLNLTERTDTLFDLVRRHKPAAVGYEQYGLQADIEHIRGEQERTQYRFKILELGGATKKEDRIRRLVPLFQQGRMWMPESMVRNMANGTQRDIIGDFVGEYLSFPVGAHDDAMDCMARIEEPDIKRFLVAPGQQARPPRIPEFRPSVAGMGPL